MQAVGAPAVGMFFGAQVGAVVTLAGATLVLHELGHSLAARVTHDFPAGREPSWINLDQLRSIWATETVGDKLRAIWSYLCRHDIHENGCAGESCTGGVPNDIMEPAAREAFVSIGGSIPQLMLDSALLAGGLELREKKPVLGAFLIGFALAQHCLNSVYPWHGVSILYGYSRPVAHHDFITFAQRVSQLTGFTPRQVGLATAVVWTLSVPTLGAVVHHSHHRSPKSPTSQWMIAVAALSCLAQTASLFSNLQTLGQGLRVLQVTCIGAAFVKVLQEGDGDGIAAARLLLSAAMLTGLLFQQCTALWATAGTLGTIGLNYAEKYRGGQSAPS